MTKMVKQLTTVNRRFYFQREDIEACNEFVSSVFLTNSEKYKDRGSRSFKVMRQQIWEGKMTEIAVSTLLKNKWFNCSDPDMKVYFNPREKSYDADLTCDGINLHVKSQNINKLKRYGYGWMVQKNDPIVKTPKDNDVFVLCLINTTRRYVDIFEFILTLFFNNIY